MQTRPKFSPLSRLNFPAKILFHGAWKYKMHRQFDRLFCCCVELQFSRERRLIFNLIFGTTANVLFTSLVFARCDVLQIQRLDERTVTSISLKGVILILKTLTVLFDQKNPLAEQVVGKFSSIISMQTRIDVTSCV